MILCLLIPHCSESFPIGFLLSWTACFGAWKKTPPTAKKKAGRKNAEKSLGHCGLGHVAPLCKNVRFDKTTRKRR